SSLPMMSDKLEFVVDGRLAQYTAKSREKRSRQTEVCRLVPPIGLATNSKEGFIKVPRSGNNLQPRVAAAATLGIRFFNAPQPRWGCVHLHSSSQRSRRAATLGWRSLPLRGIPNFATRLSMPNDPA